MRRRILFSYVSLTLFVLIVLEIPLGLFFASRERERFTNGVLSDAMVLASLFEDTLDQGEPLDPDSAQEYATRTGARVLVVDATGLSVVDTDSDPGRSFVTRPEIATALAGERAQGDRFSETLQQELLFVAVPVASGGEVHGAVRLTLPVSELDERISRFWIGLASIGALVLVAVAGLGAAVAGSVTAPVRALQDNARAFGEGDLTARPTPAGAPGEVRELNDSLNAMAHRLRELLDEQRSFVADASHQLRTPLTALRLRLENVDGDLTPEEVRAEVDAAVAEVDRLSLLVEQLLHLARAEQPRDTAAVSATDIVRDRVETWRGVAELAGQSLTADLPQDPLVVTLVAHTLEQILDNLIDNALNAGGQGDDVRVTLRPGVAGVLLTVEDHGIGLDPADRSRALDRFWRGRSDIPGSGLGLPIVVALARVHGGDVTLTDTPGGGLTVTVRLGLATAPVRTRPSGS